MEAIRLIKGPVSVLDRASVDTDQVMPASSIRRLRASISSTGQTAPLGR